MVFIFILKILYPNFAHSIVEVNSIPNLVDFARSHDTTYKKLKKLNPWLRSSTGLHARGGKVYQIKMPF